MAFIEMQADLKQTNLLLERLTRALERILLEQYEVRYGHCAEPAPDPNPREKETVDYASDEATVKRELLKLAGQLKDDDEATY